MSILPTFSVSVLSLRSSGAYISVGPGYQFTYASGIKKRTCKLTGTAGLITDAVQAKTILANGDADMVMMARELLRSYFLLRAAYKIHANAS